MSVVGVFNLLNPTEVESSRGTAFTNRALAAFFREIDGAFPTPASISQIAPTMLAVMLTSGPPPKVIIPAKELISRCTAKCAGVARFGVGFYLATKAKLPGDASKLDPRFALDYARYASCAPALLGTRTIEVFSANTALSLIGHLRSLGRHAEAMSDYSRLKEIGVDYAGFHNQAGLCYLEATEPNLQAALGAFSRAVDLSPKDPFFVANLAMTEFGLGNRLAAHLDFSRIEKMDSAFKLPEVYQPSRALAAFEQFKLDPSKVKREDVLLWLRAASGKTSPKVLGISDLEIQEAFKKTSAAVDRPSNDTDKGDSQ
jgi:tetratricopeptide (TPR) repeat protein